MSLLDHVNSPEDLKDLSVPQLEQLAADIRELILDTMNRNGGHLASNLGAVEMTIALHKAFNFLNDVILFDVSHQCYTHKILTGRRDRFPTIRTKDGLFGFTHKDESPYDHYTWSHASTSLSTGLGIAAGSDLAGHPRKVVCVIGDSAFSSGLPFEALNNAGVLKKNLLVVLNDNRMSIAPAVGAFSNYLNKIRTAPLYNELKDDLAQLLDKFPRIEHAAAHVRDRLLPAIAPGHVFETLGFRYFGPVDGHDLKALGAMIEKVKDIDDVVLLHVLTEKGRGWDPAKDDRCKMHAVKSNFKVPDSIKTSETPRNAQRDWSKAFGDIMCEMADDDPRIVAITAGMPDGTGLVGYHERHPERFFDVGICEQHGVAFSSGLAHSGLKPVAAIYSTFLQRAFDQIFHEVSLNNTPVIFAMDRAGLVGADGATAHGLADIPYLRIWPNVFLMAPRDEEELRQMLFFAKEQDISCGIRFPRDAVPTELPDERTPIAYGKSELLADGDDATFFAYGAMVDVAMQARRLLEKDGLSLRVINARFAKPVDIERLLLEVGDKRRLYTLEEGWLDGGFGTACVEALMTRGADVSRIIRIGVENRYIEAAGRGDQLRETGLDAESLAARVRQDLTAQTPA